MDINNLPDEKTVKLYPVYNVDCGYFTVWVGIKPDGNSGYVQIGEPAKVTFNLNNRSEVTNATVAALRQENQNIRAEAEQRCIRNEEKINSLLAITQAA